MSEDEAARVIQERFRALRSARQVRAQVRVRTEAPGIVGTRIRSAKGAGTPSLGVHPDTPLGRIQGNLDSRSEYNRLRVLGGASRGAVLGPGPGQGPQPAAALAAGVPRGTAVINGGFFAHTPEMRSEEDMGPALATPEELANANGYTKAHVHHERLRKVGKEGVGRPVGPTGTRSDHLPIPAEYEEHYGRVTVGGRVGLSSGPMLASQGVPTPLPDDDRFRYRLDVGEDGDRERLDNPRNQEVGVLTHAGDPNARAAISVQGEDSVLHTLTVPSMAPRTGATMKQWQQITAAGAGIRPARAGADPVASAERASTLNLDGGGSVYMGIRDRSGAMRVIAKGQRPEETKERPVGNVIATRSPVLDGSKEWTD